MSDAGAFEQDELIAAAIDSRMLNLWVSLPGIVQSYDDATKTCVVQPAVKRPIEREDGSVKFEDCPAIKNVPVAHWGGAGLTSNFTLGAGDACVLVWFDFSPALWRRKGALAEPGDTRAHGPGYPVALPWWRPSGGPGEDNGNSIGKPGGLRLTFGDTTIDVGTGADFVAMASKADLELAALKTALATWAGAFSPGGAGGAATGATAASTFAGFLSSWPSGTVAGSKLKSDL